MRGASISITILLLFCLMGWGTNTIADEGILRTYTPLIHIQKRLSELGYSPGPLEGKESKETTAAIRKFQRDNGLAAKGTLDKATLQKLGVSDLQNWETLKIPELHAVISFPTFLKSTVVERRSNTDIRIQNYVCTNCTDTDGLKKNEYFLEFRTEPRSRFDYEEFKSGCDDTPRKYPRFKYAYTCTPKLYGDASVTHCLAIWKNGKEYNIQINASQLSAAVVKRIFSSIRIY